MNLIDERDRKIQKGDIVEFDNGEKFLVIYESDNIGWHFLNLNTMTFRYDSCVDIEGYLFIGAKISGLGKIIDVIKANNISLVFR